MPAKIQNSCFCATGIGGRSVVLTMIRKNAGGLANFLKRLDIESRDGKSPEFKQSSFDKKRSIEIQWLEAGGNPNVLYQAIDEGAGKTATGKKFYELYLKKANGESLRLDQWVALVFSGLFGKKYEGEKLGEPVTTTATVAATASVWVKIISGIVATLGTVYLTITKVRAINDEQKSREQAEAEIMAEMRRNAELQRQQQGQQQQEEKKFSNVILIAAGALTLGLVYMATKKKKEKI